MSTILGQIGTLDRIERISFFETLFASGEEGRTNFLLILAQADEASRVAFYEGMHGNALKRWEDQRLALDPPTADAVRAAEQVVLEILEDVTRIAAEITAIDTLHIAVDLADVLWQAVTRLKPGGQMGIFWESWIRAGPPETHLQSDNTRLAYALKKLGMAYNVIDFTEANNRLWQTTRRVLEELRADFEAEGNAIIYETTMGETNRMDGGTGCRYLYLVSTESEL